MPYEDVATGRIEIIPHCIWFPYRNALLRQVAEKYGAADSPQTAPPPAKKAA
jgi:hypothetical protein